ncbi:Uncharacterized protein YP598_4399 (plasmid) [Yersinia pseudotuberculosis]|uniref:Uncharacterized protein n=1 Tax=Yersinia pseudotuberculosis serotype O:1b (strain IP 31758) TaxID=349747 RepID=A0A0U1QTJ0_YERP3|nr:hypothetical protein YpsIP31758_B0024 [Yersinia pseudotuberculosis IP 31758]UFA64008.1 Uncharacterized protein YP598_4399 [Yersinia pseudotuberculosis]
MLEQQRPTTIYTVDSPVIHTFTQKVALKLTALMLRAFLAND